MVTSRRAVMRNWRAASLCRRCFHDCRHRVFFFPKLLVWDQPPILTATAGQTSREQAETEPGGKPVKKDPTGDGWDQLRPLLERERKGAPEAILVLLAEAVDRRRRWFKQLDKEAVVVECAPLRAGELSKWIVDQVELAGKKIEQEALNLLLLEGENDLWHIYNELQKFVAYLGMKSRSSALGWWNTCRRSILRAMSLN